ncbi:ead/Ea22-like family protein [Enterobacter oligotrophicus]
MSNIDKQALRKLATDAHELGIIKRYTKGIEAQKKFIAEMTPATVLALLDELEAAEQERKNWRTSFDNERFRSDKLAAALSDEHEQRVMASRALITQHIRANEIEAQIVEQKRSLDHREFLLLSANQVQREYAEALGCAGDNESILEAIDDMKKRIADLEAKLQAADKLQDSAFRHGLQHGFSLGQTDDQGGFERCLAAYSKKMG